MSTSYSFPTRHWPYRRPFAAGLAPGEAPSALPAGRLYRFVMGLDPPPGREMSGTEREALNDPLAVLLLRRGLLPLSLRTLIAGLDEHNAAPDNLPEQLSFVIAEGGQIHWSPETAALNRGFRFVIGRGRGGSLELFVSTSAPFDSEVQFLQVLAWDPVAGAFQYYERRAGSWFWAGNSWDALAEPTRGQGPFDSHVSGAMVMKELKAPWLHWDSMAQTIPPEALAPDDPLRTEPLFTGRSGGQVLEQIVRRGIDRWTQARLDRLSGADGRVRGVVPLMRQVLATTTVNIASAAETFRGDDDEPLRPPLDFFFNATALLDLLAIEADFDRPEVRRGRYRQAAEALNLRLIDSRQQPPFVRPGDAFFAWAVPEPAFEDLNVLDHLLRRGLLSRRFAASLLMVDFTNPIGSRGREGLLRWVPEEADRQGPGNIEGRMADAIEAALPGLPAEAPERALVADLALTGTEWEAAFAARIERFMAAVQIRLDSDDGLLDLMRLADSRRRAFRRRPLAEFDLSLPWTDVPRDAPFLKLDAEARVSPTSDSLGDPIMPTIRFDPPGFLDDLDETGRAAWHEFISDAIDQARAGRPDLFDFDGPREQFFNPATIAPAADAVTEDIAWTAFPRQVQISSISDLQRWRRADASRDRQDEYCEWSVTRDEPTGKVVRVTFTCEGPEYWRFLAAVDPGQVLELYRAHVDPAAQPEDLFANGVYRPRNRWNNSTSEGAMHLIQPNNTLGAEIELAGGSSVVRVRPDGSLLTGARELIDCGRYGAPERHSDPHIGDRVNFHTRSNRADITLANPVGIYFASLDTSGWAAPDGDDPASFWRYTRGTPEKPVRAVLEVPQDRPYVLGDVTIDGRPIAFGGQIADRIQMKLTGLVTRIGQSTVEPMRGCRSPRGQLFGMAPAAAAAPSVAAVLAATAPEGGRR